MQPPAIRFVFGLVRLEPWLEMVTASGVVLSNVEPSYFYAEDEGYADAKAPKKQRPPLTLPAVPPGLTPEQVRSTCASLRSPAMAWLIVLCTTFL